MKKVFADTHYWLAIANPKDQWHGDALAARKQVKAAMLVTCDEVLSEFLTGLSHGGEVLRKKAAQFVQAIMVSNQVEVMEQSRETFLNGLDLYRGRFDKEYSLVDCISMTHMKSLGITEILTHDEHFTQEGFVALIKTQAV
ncbi:MAG: PIN domain-containing protein [candidate division KSB1 bacterium]